jgi:hypothetical protein
MLGENRLSTVMQGATPRFLAWHGSRKEEGEHDETGSPTNHLEEN